MLLLENLKRMRQQRGLHPQTVSMMTGLSNARVRQLELHTRQVSEPWFREAVVLARVLNADGILPLMSDDKHKPLTTFQLGAPTTVDRDVWRSGIAIDLATACRVALEFGLSDPLYLVEPPRSLITEIWTTLEAGERSAPPGSCPWCLSLIVGGTGHLPTCLPANIWGVRAREMAPNVSFATAPKSAGGAWGASGLAHGLKRLRTARGVTQARMGQLFGVKSDHYAKLERCVINLPVSRAQCLANKIGCDVNEIYHL